VVRAATPNFSNNCFLPRNATRAILMYCATHSFITFNAASCSWVGLLGRAFGRLLRLVGRVQRRYLGPLTLQFGLRIAIARQRGADGWGVEGVVKQRIPRREKGRRRARRGDVKAQRGQGGRVVVADKHRPRHFGQRLICIAGGLLGAFEGQGGLLLRAGGGGLGVDLDQGGIVERLARVHLGCVIAKGCDQLQIACYLSLNVCYRLQRGL